MILFLGVLTGIILIFGGLLLILIHLIKKSFMEDEN
jgi:hypothetical protein